MFLIDWHESYHNWLHLDRSGSSAVAYPPDFQSQGRKLDPPVLPMRLQIQVPSPYVLCTGELSHSLRLNQLTF